MFGQIVMPIKYDIILGWSFVVWLWYRISNKGSSNKYFWRSFYRNYKIMIWAMPALIDLSVNLTGHSNTLCFGFDQGFKLEEDTTMIN